MIMVQKKEKKAFATKDSRILGELSSMTCEQVMAALKSKKQVSGVNLDTVVEQGIQYLGEQSRVLNKQTELSAAQMLVHFDI